MNIKVRDRIYELTDCCKWEIRNGILWNCNTQHDEGVDGDIVEYWNSGVRYKGHVVGTTCFQFIETEEWGKVILNAQEYRDRGVEFTHNTPVRGINTKYITTEEAIEACKKPEYTIPSEFLSIFPNNFGINLCAVKGFEVVMTDDDQYQSIRVDFIPVEHRVGIDGRENI